MKHTNPIIYFDGVCILCNKLIRFIIKHDKKKVFLFSTLPSGDKASPQLLSGIRLSHQGHYYYKSTAVLMIAKILGGGFQLLRIGFLIPVAIRDKIYDYVARNRYKWFGKSDVCLVMTPEMKARFI